MRGGGSMSGVRNWAFRSAIAAPILASPGIALLMFIVAGMSVDLLMDLAALALLTLATGGAPGWFVLQRQSVLSEGGFEFVHDPRSEERPCQL
jgi:hypothetical protein